MPTISDLYRYRVEVFGVNDQTFRLGWFPSQAAAEEYAQFFVKGHFPGVRSIEITYDTNVPPFYEGLIKYWLDCDGWNREYIR